MMQTMQPMQPMPPMQSMQQAAAMQPLLIQPSDMRRKSTATVECPKSMVGRVIGKNGETIKALQTYTGSLIQVNQVDNPCQITISGNPQSLSLAVSMVADIVKGTFKGFALLRQVASPGNPQRAPVPVYQPPQPLPQAQPVYAPGYGLIPPSQLYGGDDRTLSIPSAFPGAPLPGGLSWSPAQVPQMLGMQAVGQRPFNPNNPNTAALLGGQGPVYGAAPGGVGYYPGQDMTGKQGDALFYQDVSGGMYSTGMSGDGGPTPGSSTAKLMQASGMRNGGNGNGNGLHQRGGAGWLPRTSGYTGGSAGMMGELMDNSNAAMAGGAGNLVMDADGQVYYVNGM